jgi:phosphoribosylaminoimidazole-succinocarboxamide synthase
VARGYLTGSGLIDYEATGEVCGVPLPPGLVDGSRLPEAIFTPATKAAIGEHDENVSFEAVVETVGADVAERLRDLTLAVYGRAETVARERGIIVADTKLEFGVVGRPAPGTPAGRHPAGTIVLADEVLTPDSSRFWPADDYEPGRGQASFDKQYVRDYLNEQDWDHSPPAPALPPEVIAGTTAKYREAYERITGRKLD